jgi:hypothetical protein
MCWIFLHECINSICDVQFWNNSLLDQIGRFMTISHYRPKFVLLLSDYWFMTISHYRPKFFLLLSDYWFMTISHYRPKFVLLSSDYWFMTISHYRPKFVLLLSDYWCAKFDVSTMWVSVQFNILWNLHGISGYIK